MRYLEAFAITTGRACEGIRVRNIVAVLCIPFFLFACSGGDDTPTSGGPPSGDPAVLDWTCISPTPTPNRLFASFFVSASTGFMSGEFGEIWKTTDAGTSWTAIATPTLESLHDIGFSGTAGIAVGTNGTILWSTDSGATWSARTSGTTQTLEAAAIADANTAWAVGHSGTIVYTTDAGVTWTAQSPPTGVSAIWYGADFLDANQGWIVGTGGNIITTTNGGSTWTEQTNTDTHNLSDVDFSGPQTGIAVGLSGTILWTTDGGTTWNSQAQGIGTITAVHMRTTSEAIAVGVSGSAYFSSDGGASWTSSTTSVATTLNACVMLSSSSALAFGNAGELIETANTGTSWSSLQEGPTLTLWDIACADDMTILAAGVVGTVVRSLDGGATWTSQTVASPTGTLYGISFPTATTGYVVGEEIHKTTNAGDTWSDITPSGSTIFWDVATFTDQKVWAVASGGRIAYSEDGGTSFADQTSNTTSDLYAVDFLDGLVGIAVGRDGAITRTTDGGATWAANATGVPVVRLRAVDVVSPTLAFAGGDFGTLLKSTDGGASWSTLPLASTDVKDIVFTSAGTGTVVGALGLITRTTDGGSTWTENVSFTSNWLYSVAFRETNSALAVGSSGAITQGVAP
jgi:photosystem II stability/assembly factor-like uncharacterized protein